jgi:hypothetical protein
MRVSYKGISDLSLDISDERLARRIVSDTGGNNFTMSVEGGQGSGGFGAFTIETGTIGNLSEKFRIQQSGNVGIGTISPSAKLHLSDTTNGFVGLRLEGTGTYAGSDWIIYASSSSPSSADDFLGFYNNSATDGATQDYKLRIFKTGIVDISGPLVVKGTLPADQTSAAVIDHLTSKMRIFSYGASGTTGTFEFRNAAGGAGSNLVATINASGVYTAVSDINKKKDFETSTIGLNAILGLKPTLYRMNSDESEGDKELGFIAQEVKEFIPQAYVESGEDDAKFIGLNYNAIVAALVKSVQELKSENDNLKSRLEVLEQS